MANQNEKLKELPGESLCGWNITPEQIRFINIPFHALHAVNVFRFYEDNLTRLQRMANAFMRNHIYLFAIVSAEDLVQQLYCDLLGGVLKLPAKPEQIRKAIYKSFRYAAVGGLEGVEDVKEFRTARAPA